MIFSNILNYLFKMKQPNYYRVQTVTNIKSYKGATGTSVIVSAIKMSYFVSSVHRLFKSGAVW